MPIFSALRCSATPRYELGTGVKVAGGASLRRRFSSGINPSYTSPVR